MDKILSNLALIDAVDFCKKNSIDCSGTHLVKYPRKWIYALVNDTGKAVLTTTFYPNQVPTHCINR